MKSWLLSILGAVFLISITSMLLPEGRIKKSVTSVYSLIIFIIILKGLSLISINIFSNDFEVELQDNLLNYVENENRKIKEEEGINILENYGIKNSLLTIIYGLDEDNLNVPKSVIINLRSAVIISTSEHIDIIDKAQKSIAEYFNVDVKNVIIQS